MAPAILLLMVIMIIMFHKTSLAKEIAHPCSSSCGNIHNISYPFRLTTDPSHCGSFRYNLSCENNLTVLYLPVTTIDPVYEKTVLFVIDLINQEYQRYHVQAINYDNYTIRLVDPNVKRDDCSSIPNNSASQDSVFEVQGSKELYQPYYDFMSGRRQHLVESVIYLNCEKPVLNSSYYIDAGSCAFNRTSSTRQYYSYFYVFDRTITSGELEPSCWIQKGTLITKGDKNDRKTPHQIHNALVYGFELSWLSNFGTSDETTCLLDDRDPKVFHCVSLCLIQNFVIENNHYHCDLYHKCLAYLELLCLYYGGYKYIVGLLASRTMVGVSFIVALCIYKWRRRHLSLYDGIEEFLQSRSNLMPVRYSYWEIKKITRGFKDKLGEGGFGSVFKGKLRSGRYVAIKLLGKSKTNIGQDFINEIASIGRIHHVNVVRLIGFCVEGSKHALVYDFMPNGSLDQYIFSRQESDDFLSFDEIFKISLGVARGIEYLHRGCDMQILHFDIKPHNILLDENFIPKVSDFGLARLYPLDKSIVSLTAVRGTIGYIAPELFYKNIGGVSYKADVYSFGMLLMEMANRRKNLNANDENSSQIYLPSWIYGQFSEGKDTIIEGSTEEEAETVKKMIIVALWCIQLKPFDRPSMSKVIEMLEGKVESLQMPPKPSYCPQFNRNEEDGGETSKITSSSTLSDEESPEDSLKEDGGETSKITSSSTLSDEESPEDSLISNAH